MKIILMAIGGALCVFGLADLIGSYAGFDVWGDYIGVQLPELLWKFSAYVELLLGYFAFKAGKATVAAESDAQSA